MRTKLLEAEFSRLMTRDGDTVDAVNDHFLTLKSTSNQATPATLPLATRPFATRTTKSLMTWTMPSKKAPHFRQHSNCMPLPAPALTSGSHRFPSRPSRHSSCRAALVARQDRQVQQGQTVQTYKTQVAPDHVAPDHVAFFCNTLRAHHIRPINVLKKVGLDLEEWDQPDVATALFKAMLLSLSSRPRVSVPPTPL
jgi:hypothetical protein